ncbi:diaminopimelate epimerase [Candidatus Nomurabacteria bacterium RIFCSPLOWO2_02_FULL_40_10]|uniref:Diaminopimelate epimerase n=2 Tax=Candidatus Nomuraibacteriota TaxID=1752729 RepID=A0A1F6XY71_9BACT|nr:MAG: diaminopimelate epimerase [Candidatus Nomurabacteria bacterium RIFCSPHIGHO2_01_FULL_39_10]OGI99070.1 MAG: diaminopimelate epimerase [Candidatus Nomurabacteria bacterium RIFCSPLOWO2_02_FULL_40_10]
MIAFHKYQGTGNDFIIIDNRDKKFDAQNTKKIALLCDRHFGVGADGLILLEKSSNADCFMNYYNSDGTVAEMCGNGVRCLAKFFLELTKSKKPQKKELLIDTRTGIKKVMCNSDGSFSVNMGVPVFSHKDFPKNSLVLENIEFNFVSMGNPHAVGLVKNLSEINISQIGPKIENDSHFPNKINVEFVEKVRDDYFKVKVWERGSGATLSCGTGACAVYAILKSNHPIGKTYRVAEITLEFTGGNLHLSENEKGEIILRGPAEFVFKREMKIARQDLTT